MESGTFLSRLHDVWAYVALGASGILTEEAAPIVGGFAAAQGHLGFGRVVVVCALGTWIAGALLYALGRWRGRWVRKRFRRVGRYMTRLLVIVRRNPWRSAFGARFAFGVRIVLPMACGAARLRLGMFLFGSGVAAVLWSLLFVGIGWVFGESAVLLLDQVRRYEDVVAALIVAGVILVFVAVVRRRGLKRVERGEAPRNGSSRPD